jgi:hypothetical protein
MGNIAPAAPMVAKRLREKLLTALPGLGLITVRGKGYKICPRRAQSETGDRGETKNKDMRIKT